MTESRLALFFRSRRAKQLLLSAAVLAVLIVGGWSCMISMPGRSWSGALPPASDPETRFAMLLQRDVEMLAGTIGIRTSQAKLAQSADYIESRFKEAGLAPAREAFEARKGKCFNVEAEIRGHGKPDEIIVIGAHYDSAHACPGANDNATGVAAMLSLAGSFARSSSPRTLRFVAFANEEPPSWETEEMGSRVHARRCKERGEKIVAMISLETLGCYSDRDGSQRYPFPVGLFYPSQGNFAAFVGNLGSRSLVRQLIGSFRRHASFPSEGAALPSWLPGVGWSDHASFWKEGYAAVMVTDTAPFRYAEYHTPNDTPDKVDYERCARVVSGLREAIAELARD